MEAVMHRRTPVALRALLAACGGFLAATLWFDLMFDVQVLAHEASAPLPEATIVSIASYYRRVTTDARPMHLLIATVMVVTLLGSMWRVVRSRHRGLGWIALLTAAAPIGLAGARVFPNAIRLGSRVGPLDQQSALARSIFSDHVFCLASIAVFTALQVVLATREARPDGHR
jgi:cytochrome bd-type quinol oxidase subunit 2